MTAQLPWHKEHWSRLAQLRRQERLPHALLLRGPAGLGKSLLAERLARAWVCPRPLDDGRGCGDCPSCHQAEAGTHPDVLHIAPEEPGRPIKIDAVRRLVQKSNLSAQPGAYRVCVIDPADALNRAAANAMLKTLEEPAPRTILVLVSARPDRLPATIRSRCQVLAFRLPDPSTARAWLAEQDVSADLETSLRLAAGAPLRALEAAEQDWSGEAKRLAEELAALKARGINPMQVVENWEKRSLNAVTAGLKRLFADLVKAAFGVSDHALYHPNMRAELCELVQGVEPRGLFGFADSLTDCERSATNNANIQMTLEHLVNEWLQLTRPGGR
jgi:DNA polymerase-3 subunit delta'